MNNQRMKNLVFLAFIATVLPMRQAVWAHDQVPGAPQAGPIVILNATVHVGDGTVLDNASVLFEDGKLVSVGASVDIPQDASTVNGDGLHVYPGLIDSWTDLGLREITAVDVSVDNRELGDLNPNVRTWVAINPDSELIPVARSGGVLMAHVIPGGAMMRGQSAVIRLDGWDTHDMVIQPATALCMDWEKMIPQGDDAKKNAKEQNEKIRELDELLKSAARYGEAQTRTTRSAEGIAAATDVRLESLLPVLAGDRPVFVRADSMAAILSAVQFMVPRGIKMVLCGGFDAERCGDVLKRHDIPVIIGGIYRLPRHRHDAYDAAYTLPLRLKAMGIRFAIAGEGPGYPGGASNVRNLPYHAAMAVAFGLPRESAIEAITSSAADILGVSADYGTLQLGKSATFIVTDGDVLETTTQVVDAYIDGSKVDLNNKHRQLYNKYQQKYRDAP